MDAGQSAPFPILLAVFTVSVLLIWIVPFVIALAVSRIFARGWAVFFLASTATGFGLFGAFASLVISGTANSGGDEFILPPWPITTGICLLTALVSASVPSWLFVRWRRKELAKQAASAFG
jgi:hypothetical protein